MSRGLDMDIIIHGKFYKGKWAILNSWGIPMSSVTRYSVSRARKDA